MSVILILLIASLLLASLFLVAFIWSVRNGQYDDDYTPSVRVLFEEKKAEIKKEKINPRDNTQNGTTATINS